MNKVVVCCSCGNIPDYSKKSFKILFPEDEMPKMYVGINQIRKYADGLSPDFNITKYLLALARNKNKYSHYFEYDEETGVVSAQWDLVKGRRIL